MTFTKITIFLILFILTSCTQKTETKSITQDSADIVSDYVDTLENSIVDAKKVAKDMNARNEKMNEQLR